MKAILFFISFGFLFCTNSTSSSSSKSLKVDTVRNYDAFHQEALAYCKENDFNESCYFLIDMSVHSGKNRFFIYYFTTKNNKIKRAAITHIIVSGYRCTVGICSFKTLYNLICSSITYTRRERPFITKNAKISLVLIGK